MWIIVDGIVRYCYLSEVVSPRRQFVQPNTAGHFIVHPSALPALSALPTITPGSAAHAALIERTQKAYEHEVDHHAERARMLLHLLRNTLRNHCDPNEDVQMAELRQIVVDIQAGRYVTFGQFSSMALAPFVKTHRPTPPARKPMSHAEFVERRNLEDEQRGLHIRNLVGERRRARGFVSSESASAK